jgi:hypothetical protein
MQQNPKIEIPKMYRTLLNHLYEIERKVRGLEDFKKIARNIERMKDAFRTELNPAEPDLELYYEDPMGQPYDETRNDLDANIAGESTENLFVVDVIKPIIVLRYGNSRERRSKIVQKGVVIVNSNTKQEETEE